TCVFTAYNLHVTIGAIVIISNSSLCSPITASIRSVTGPRKPPRLEQPGQQNYSGDCECPPEIVGSTMTAVISTSMIVSMALASVVTFLSRDRVVDNREYDQ